MANILASTSALAIAFADNFRPEPDILVSQWADKHREVGKPSPWAGKWVTDRVPYAREIMDRLSPCDSTEIVVHMKAAQIAGTEIALNALGCWIDRYPDSAMLILPTTGQAKKFVRTRLDPMIALNERVKAHIAPAKSRQESNTVALKAIRPDIYLVIAGANSGPDVRSYPARYLLMDEVDEYPADLDKQGDTVELLLQRTSNFSNRKVLLTSTPTAEHNHIHKWYLAGDQNQFHIPCPHCDHGQALIWYAGKDRPGGVRWPKGCPEQARYQCERCGEYWEEWQKASIFLRGRYVPKAPGNGGGVIRSYHTPAMLAPYGWKGSSWASLALRFEQARNFPVNRKTFWNLALGEPYLDAAERRAEPNVLVERRERWGEKVPAGVGVITVGADVQGNRIEAERVGWGQDEESWSLAYRIFYGDPTSPDIWRQFDDWLQEQLQHELGVPISARAACIDAGYYSQIVRRFCGERFGRHVWPIVGRAGQRPVWPRKPGRRVGQLPPSFVIGVDTVKDVVYSHLAVSKPGPGFCHFPVSPTHDLAYFDQLCSEIRTIDYSHPIPIATWKKKTEGHRNEALDARGYAYAALCGLGASMGFRLNVEVAALRRQAESITRHREPLATEKTVGDGMRSSSTAVYSDAWS